MDIHAGVLVEVEAHTSLAEYQVVVDHQMHLVVVMVVVVVVRPCNLVGLVPVLEGV